MTPEKLLRKRYKLIADYPFNNLPVDCIIEFDIESVWVTHNGELVSTNNMIAGLASSYYYSNIVKIINYPHLFKKLEWWEDRKPEDMPEYVKLTAENGGYILKVKKHYLKAFDREKFLDCNDCITAYFRVLPATKEEYLNQSK